MIEVTYIYTSYSDRLNTGKDDNSTYLLTPRIMCNILEHQKNLKVTYSDIPLISFLSYYEYCKINHSVGYMTEYWNAFYSSIIDEIETEYVLLSLGSSWDVIFLGHLLNNGKKVVVGGAFTKNYDLKSLRDIFKVNGANNLDNVIIVRPYINKELDFATLIKNWKDIDIDVKFDTSDSFIVTAEKDIYLEHISTLNSKGFYFNRLPVMLQTECFWGKCSFCKYTVNNNKFVSEKNVGELANSVMKSALKYKTKYIFIFDPEFYFTKLNRRFLDIMRENNFKISFFTSVRLLKTEQYWNYVKIYSDVIHSMSIGFESLNDFTLQILNKGVTCKDSFEVIFKIINHNLENSGNNIIGIDPLFMGDLISEDKESIIKSYDLLEKFRVLMVKSNTPYNLYFSRFIMSPLTEYSKSPYIRLKDHPLKVLNEYERIDNNGNVLPSDIDIVGDTFSKWRNQEKLTWE